MTKQPIYPGGRNTAAAAYTPGIAVGDLVFVSGQGPLNPHTMAFENLDIAHQTRRTLENVREILQEAGCSMADVVKATVHLQNIHDFAAFNAVYEQFFDSPRPARTTVQSVLGAGISVEIDVIAIRGCGGKA